MPTDSSQGGPNAPRAGAPRPTLLGARATSDDARQDSILEVLAQDDQPAKAPRATPARRNPRWLMGAAGVALLGVLAWKLGTGDAGDSAAREPAASQMTGAGKTEADGRTATGSVVVADAATTAAPPAASAETSGGVSTSARIEDLTSTTAPLPGLANANVGNDAASTTAAKTAPGTAATAATAAMATAAAATVVGANRLVVTSEPESATPTKAKKVTKPERNTEGQAASRAKASSENVRRASAPTSPPAVAAAFTPAPAARAPNPAARQDDDVAIVAALMSQIDGRPSAEPATAAAPLPTTAPASASKSSRSTAPRSIADLVASCRGAPGSTQVLACRWDICKGYWGKADACPARDRKAAKRAASELNARKAS